MLARLPKATTVVRLLAVIGLVLCVWGAALSIRPGQYRLWVDLIRWTVLAAIWLIPLLAPQIVIDILLGQALSRSAWVGPAAAGFCRACDYPLVGLENHACPECGRAFDPEDPSSYGMGRRHPIARLLARSARLLGAFTLVWMIWSWLSLSASLGHYFGSPLTFIASIVGLALATALVGRSRVVAAVMLVIGFWYGRTLYENWHGHRPMMYASRVVHEGMTEEQVRDALAAFSERPWSVSFFDVFFFRETRPYEYPRWPPGVGPPGVALYIHGGTGGFHDHCAFSAEYEDGVCVRVKVSCPD